MRDSDEEAHLTSETSGPISTPLPVSSNAGNAAGVTQPSSEVSRSSLKISDIELPKLQIGPTSPATERGRRISLTVLLVICFFAVAYIASPLWVGITLGTVMAFSVQPTYRRFARRFGDRKHLAAAVLTLSAGLFCTLAGFGALYVVAAVLFDIISVLQRKIAQGSLEALIGNDALKLLDHAHIDRGLILNKIRDSFAQLSDAAGSELGAILGGTTSAFFGLTIALLTMYYVLLEWPTIALRLERTLPLDPRHTRALMLEFRDVGRSAMIGTLMTAAVQGGFAFAGFAMCGVPQPLTWAIVTALASFVPLVGTSVVWGPMAIYLISRGDVARGILEFSWGFLIVMALADYVIRPRIVGAKGHGHPLLMLIALLGGIEVLGLPGLIVAPILMSIFVAVLRIYERDGTRMARAPRYR